MKGEVKGAKKIGKKPMGRERKKQQRSATTLRKTA
jgi:hypothetical protein